MKIKPDYNALHGLTGREVATKVYREAHKMSQPVLLAAAMKLAWIIIEMGRIQDKGNIEFPDYAISG